MNETEILAETQIVLLRAVLRWWDAKHSDLPDTAGYDLYCTLDGLDLAELRAALGGAV